MLNQELKIYLKVFWQGEMDWSLTEFSKVKFGDLSLEQPDFPDTLSDLGKASDKIFRFVL